MIHIEEIRRALGLAKAEQKRLRAYPRFVVKRIRLSDGTIVSVELRCETDPKSGEINELMELNDTIRAYLKREVLETPAEQCEREQKEREIKEARG